MPHLDVPGAALYYETAGHVSAPALVLLHSPIAHLRMWDPQVAALAAHHFVIRFDARGFGKTESENVQFSNRADTLDLLDHLGVETATLIGCGRGGTIALDIALESPNRVMGIVSIGGGPSGFPEIQLSDAEDALFDALDEAFTTNDSERLARLEVALWAVGPLRDENDLDADFVRTATGFTLDNVARAAERPVPLPLDPPAVDRVIEIAAPALITVGEYDLTPALAEYEYLLEVMPQASGCTFRDTAHLPSVEHPAEFQRVLISWLARNGL
ncbi:alpha/beta fold hydrolase [Cryobacterium roopkundense]|nr:alpha/beta hydrolase [Cryobacterium roopkundense]MBB5643002.1 pimeloyl-ACP methyl ester carboxylesterase [Cryobacterium roopkundense]